MTRPDHPLALIITLLLAAFLLLPSMASVGMFVDGIMYAAVSRNLAEGLGSLWAPHFSGGLFPVFHEHPPLVFWVQSLFFRALGDSYLTERAYDLIVVFATALLIRTLWFRITLARGLGVLAAYWWLPLLMWVAVPKWSWAYRNNVLENTMTVFCLASMVLVLGALRSSGMAKAAWFAVAAAGAALLAFLAKGPVGLFVLASPLLLAPTFVHGHWGDGHHGDWRRGLIVLAVVCGVFFALLSVLLAWPEAREMLGAYWDKQVAGRSGVSGADIGMLSELAKKIVPMLLVLAGLRLWVWRDAGFRWSRPVLGPAAAMLAVGLSASLPLVLGDLDSAHYLVPALPFFALAFGLLGASMMDSAGARIRASLTRAPGKLFGLASFVIAAIILADSVARIGEVRKNEDYHAFLARVAAEAGEHRSLAVDEALYDDWYLHAIAQRHYRISLVPGLVESRWRLAPALQEPPDGYRATAISSSDWVLQRRENQHPAGSREID